MNKKLIASLILIAGPAQLAADAASLSDLNIRTVNIIDIMRESEEGKKIASEVEQLRKDLTNELENSQKDYMKETEEFKTKVATLSADARKQLEERLIGKRRDIEAQVQKAEDKLKYTMQNVSDRLTTKAQAEIDKYAQTNKIDLVMDISSGRAVYSSPKADITHSMIGNMNSEYKKELAHAKTMKPEASKLAAKPATGKTTAA